MAKSKRSKKNMRESKKKKREEIKRKKKRKTEIEGGINVIEGEGNNAIVTHYRDNY